LRRSKRFTLKLSEPTLNTSIQSDRVSLLSEPWTRSKDRPPFFNMSLYSNRRHSNSRRKFRQAPRRTYRTPNPGKHQLGDVCQSQAEEQEVAGVPCRNLGCDHMSSSGSAFTILTKIIITRYYYYYRIMKLQKKIHFVHTTLNIRDSVFQNIRNDYVLLILKKQGTNYEIRLNISAVVPLGFDWQ
jgi:hypothetical protein